MREPNQPLGTIGFKNITLSDGLDDNELLFVQGFVLTWSVATVLGILFNAIYLLRSDIDVVAWIAGGLYAFQYIIAVSLPKFIVLTFRTENARLLQFLFFVMVLILAHLILSIGVISLLFSQGKSSILVLFAVAGVINAVTFMPSYIYEMYQLRALRREQTAEVLKFVSENGKVTANDYNSIYPLPPGLPPGFPLPRIARRRSLFRSYSKPFPGLCRLNMTLVWGPF